MGVNVLLIYSLVGLGALLLASVSLSAILVIDVATALVAVVPLIFTSFMLRSWDSRFPGETRAAPGGARAAGPGRRDEHRLRARRRSRRPLLGRW